MKRLLTKYAMYFNRKYRRSGALIASRYKSVPIEADDYLIPLQRYIHQNPLKAGLVIRLEDYLFSSYKEFLVGGELVDTELTLGMVGRNEWIHIQQVPTDESFDISERVSLSDEEVRQKIIRSIHGKEPHEIGSWEKPNRDLM